MSVVSDWRRELAKTFSGADEPPRWPQDFAQGTDGGYFGPDSAVWAVHGSTTTIVAGIRALLVQALHPGALAGVYDFSAYREDVLGRLARTIRWIFTVTYGDTAAARAGCERVLRMHERVQGSYTDARGERRSYSANDPHLLRWVHLAFTEAFAEAACVYGPPIPGGPDRYVAEWATAAELMGVPDPPRTMAQLKQQLAGYDGELLADARVAEVVSLVRRPPLPASQRPGYRILFAGAVATLDPHYRRLLGVDVPSLGPLPVHAATR
ncbi:oxygenase MpaB family protein, partial [Arthrobacter sp. GCM10027362]|uniref:oxygenase MpaB family protein n=1 Tax=Arthrobacter sp. GCM10027362 TaxID=3273379 RepID=UPI00362A40D2